MAQTQNLPPAYGGHPGYPGPPHPQYDHRQQLSMQANGQAMQAAPPVTQTAHIISQTKDNLKYSLVVVQQPIRARMCGFGDKDRRPITPPPCVRLVVTDTRTQQEVPADQLDPSFFILQVDLWDEHGHAEKNIVKASTNSPATSISTATTTSYPPPAERPTLYAPPQVAYHDPRTGQITGYGPPPGYPPQWYGPQPHMPMYMSAPAPAPGHYAQPPMGPAYGQYPGAQPQMYPPQQYQPPVPQQQTNGGMFTRNLIGSLTVNANTLRDPQGKEGHWFVLQDLSVRTEAVFRLKMSFFDISAGRDQTKKLANGSKPVLATVFSEPFQVFSAKKFPGVIESTELSKCFAGQGIKIPIRKDGGKHEGKDEDEE
ncbi:hypothetical protein D6D23_00672 [Aureobasidium pullulans]|uniref:Velvet domain-containing protein n=1 Tax=Aureobasidium pullulans TaxID=5580 RepID=A0A4S8WXM0_AURPU|nr:hypothetical protein D6D23_00672 [Aureobasidium pullulans]THW46668.1 hypothetical protein D6D22_03033 [Aureobasidium pullulans]